MDAVSIQHPSWPAMPTKIIQVRKTHRNWRISPHFSVPFVLEVEVWGRNSIWYMLPVISVNCGESSFFQDFKAVFEKISDYSWKVFLFRYQTKVLTQIRKWNGLKFEECVIFRVLYGLITHNSYWLAVPRGCSNAPASISNGPLQ